MLIIINEIEKKNSQESVSSSTSAVVKVNKTITPKRPPAILSLKENLLEWEKWLFRLKLIEVKQN